MRHSLLAIGMCWATSAVAWAGTNRPVPPRATPAVAPTSPTNQQLDRRRASIERLRQDVARQEADSRRAARQLQRQDRTITQLQKQLQALRAKAAAESH
jgi:septal ring factor EnvC (AmiA/AmiB activator)